LENYDSSYALANSASKIIQAADYVTDTLSDVGQDEDKFGKDFKLTLYFAAPKESEAIGLSLCRELVNVCNKTGFNNFELKMRLGDAKEKQPRWDKAFIDKELTPLAGSIKKVYVCGAPVMNEMFDRALEELAPKLKLS
jgi:predicted ferric reductase